MGGTEKRGEEIKILKRGQAGSRGGCWKKKRDAGNLLRTMASQNSGNNILKRRFTKLNYSAKD